MVYRHKNEENLEILTEIVILTDFGQISKFRSCVHFQSAPHGHEIPARGISPQKPSVHDWGRPQYVGITSPGGPQYVGIPSFATTGDHIFAPPGATFLPNPRSTVDSSQSVTGVAKNREIFNVRHDGWYDAQPPPEFSFSLGPAPIVS